jgi:hypothetical protein
MCLGKGCRGIGRIVAVLENWRKLLNESYNWYILINDIQAIKQRLIGGRVSCNVWVRKRNTKDFGEENCTQQPVWKKKCSWGIILNKSVNKRWRDV